MTVAGNALCLEFWRLSWARVRVLSLPVVTPRARLTVPGGAVELQARPALRPADVPCPDARYRLPVGAHPGRLPLGLPPVAPPRRLAPHRLAPLPPPQVAHRARAAPQAPRTGRRRRPVRHRVRPARRLGRLDARRVAPVVPPPAAAPLGVGPALLRLWRQRRRVRLAAARGAPPARLVLLLGQADLARVEEDRPRRVLGDDHLVGDRRVADAPRAQAPHPHTREPRRLAQAVAESLAHGLDLLFDRPGARDDQRRGTGDAGIRDGGGPAG